MPLAWDGIIGFADADSFYAAAERVRRPWLAGVPLGVLGNQGACVIARSYEMKKFGVKVGSPVWEAKKLCPDGVYVKRDFHWYEALSRRMFAEIGQFSPKAEYYSIDEMFWEGHKAERLDYQGTATHLRDHIRRTLGLPMTVTFGRSRTLAKLFADVHKPFGAIAVLDRHHERDLLAKIPVTEIAGIAKRRAARLEPYGIRTCLDLANADGGTVRRVLTVVGHDLWRELNGENTSPIRTQRTRHKNIARGGSLAGKTSDPRALYGWLARNVERLIEELHYHQVRPAVLTVWMHYFEAGAGLGTVHLDVPTDRFDRLMEAARHGLRQAWIPGAIATHMHVVASRLKCGDAWQLSLFDQTDEQADRLAKVKKAINERYGRFTLRSGATLFSNRFYDDPANNFDICDIRGKFCF